MRRSFLLIAACLSIGLPVLGTEAWAQEADSPTQVLKIAAVHVEPAQPGPDTLCRLRLEIENAGDRTATQLGFTVTINGKKLPVYENHLFMFALPAGKTSELPLYNFWSTETSRPEPANGKLEIEVVLREARWMDISTEKDTETWTPLGDVEGLPVRASISVAMAKKTAG